MSPRPDPPKQAITQVKGGKPPVIAVRDFRGFLDRENTAIALSNPLQPVTKNTVAEAVSAGSYWEKMNEQEYPRL
jgi:hypothetical protein